jgi:hypothetical protein
MSMKYIVVEVSDSKADPESDKFVQHLPIIFPNTLIHKDMFEGVQQNLLMDENHSFNVATCIGAGFVDLSKWGEHTCYGESETLEIASRGKADSDLMDTYRFTHGIADAVTVESTLAEIVGPMGFLHKHRRTHANEILQAAVQLTKQHFEDRQLHHNGFVTCDVVGTAYSINKDHTMTLPPNLHMDYISPASTVRFGGLSHMLTIGGGTEVIEIPDNEFCKLLPRARTTDTVVSAIAKRKTFNGEAMFGEMEMTPLSPIPLADESLDLENFKLFAHVGDCILRSVTMDQENLEGFLRDTKVSVVTATVLEIETETLYVFEATLGNLFDKFKKI